MTRPRLEVAEVLRSCRDEYFEAYAPSAEQRQVFRDIVACRTAALGGHLQECERCGHQEISYNSCRNRHCPKCQACKQAHWLQARVADLLEVPYFHLVFTLPQQLGPLTLQNRRILYGILFRAASQALLTVADDETHLGARIGFLAILHTWGQTLLHHPHLHCVVPGGGLSAEGKWIACRKGFFLPVRVLSRLFQKKFVHFLRAAHRQDKLSFHGQLELLSQPARWERLLRQIQQTDWAVYCKPPFGDSRQVLQYLARYTHRIALSNHRLIRLEQGQVTFLTKNYRLQKQGTTTLAACEFTRRFLLHLLPKAFVRIRYYGFLAHRCRQEKLALCRHHLAASNPPNLDADSKHRLDPPSLLSDLCPLCRQGKMTVVQKLPPSLLLPQPRMNSPGKDACGD